MRTVLVPPGAEDAVRTFCFTANLLAQEATGTPAAAAMRTAPVLNSLSSKEREIVASG